MNINQTLTDKNSFSRTDSQPLLM